MSKTFSIPEPSESYSDDEIPPRMTEFFNVSETNSKMWGFYITTRHLERIYYVKISEN